MDEEGKTSTYFVKSLYHLSWLLCCHNLLNNAEFLHEVHKNPQRTENFCEYQKLWSQILEHVKLSSLWQYPKRFSLPEEPDHPQTTMTYAICQCPIKSKLHKGLHVKEGKEINDARKVTYISWVSMQVSGMFLVVHKISFPILCWIINSWALLLSEILGDLTMKILYFLSCGSTILTHPCKINIMWCISQTQRLLFILTQSCQHTVENVIVTFSMILWHNAGLLQKVLFNLSTFYCPITVEVDVYIFSKSWRIIIPDSFGISKG
jgi:hypothetical protein